MENFLKDTPEGVSESLHHLLKMNGSLTNISSPLLSVPGHMDTRLCPCPLTHYCVHIHNLTDRQTDTQTDRQTDRER